MIGSGRRRASGNPRADLVIVANRLPVDRVVADDGSVTWRRSPGGLVSALSPVMNAQDGAWIGWPGDVGEDIEP
ncbi:MAG: trehalose 6-phosphate synthase, partial [Nocardioidaceae bacterium]|nr:trehalose 6-phosphate synthase [Nocardioidaceae bacterium]